MINSATGLPLMPSYLLLSEVLPPIAEQLSLKDTYRLFMVSTGAYRTTRPYVLAARPVWFVDEVIKLIASTRHKGWDEVVVFLAHRVDALQPPKAGAYRQLFSRLFAPSPSTDALHQHSSYTTDLGVVMAVNRCNDDLTEVNLANSAISDESLYSLAPASQIHTLILKQCRRISDQGIQHVAKTFGTTLTYVDLSETNVSDLGVTTLLDYCPNLEVLKVDKCVKVSENALMTLATTPRDALRELSYDCYGTMTDMGILAITQGCPQLTTLRLHRAEISDQGLAAIASAPFCDTLTTLSLNGCKAITDAGICYLADTCRNLVELSMADTFISDVGLIAIANQCKALKKCNLTGCLFIKEGGVQALQNGCPFLTELELTATNVRNNALFARPETPFRKNTQFIGRTTFYTPDATPNLPMNDRDDLKMVDLMQNAPLFRRNTQYSGRTTLYTPDSTPNLPMNDRNDLKEIDLTKSGISDAELCIIATQNTLQKLILRGCHNISNVSIEYVAKLRGTTLKYIDLSGTDVSDLAVMRLLKHCLNLEVLKVDRCQKVSEKALAPIATTLRESLQVLSLGFYGTMTDGCLAAIAQGCPRLTTLSLLMAEISDEGLSALARAPCCQTLTSLSLPGCRGITNAGIRDLITVCPHLTKLNLAGTFISDAGLREIAKYCKKLEKCTLSGCIRVGDAGVNALVYNCHSLKELTLDKTSVGPIMQHIVSNTIGTKKKPW